MHCNPISGNDPGLSLAPAHADELHDDIVLALDAIDAVRPFAARIWSQQLDDAAGYLRHARRLLTRRQA